MSPCEASPRAAGRSGRAQVCCLLQKAHPSRPGSRPAIGIVFPGGAPCPQGPAPTCRHFGSADLDRTVVRRLSLSFAHRRRGADQGCGCFCGRPQLSFACVLIQARPCSSDSVGEARPQPREGREGSNRTTSSSRTRESVRSTICASTTSIRSQQRTAAHNREQQRGRRRGLGRVDPQGCGRRIRQEPATNCPCSSLLLQAAIASACGFAAGSAGGPGVREVLSQPTALVPLGLWTMLGSSTLDIEVPRGAFELTLKSQYARNCWRLSMSLGGKRTKGSGMRNVLDLLSNGARLHRAPDGGAPAAPRPSRAWLLVCCVSAGIVRVAMIPPSAAQAAPSVWSVTRSPNAGAGPSQGPNELFGISCFSSTFCMAVGYFYDPPSNQTLTEKWDGSRWISGSSAGEGDFGVLDAVSCTSPTSCMAVGYDTVSGNDQTLAESWNGSEWSILPTPNISGSLEAVSCSGISTCVAVGNYYDNGSGLQNTLMESWNGSTWSVVASPTPPPSMANPDLVGVSCIGSNGYLPGGGVLLGCPRCPPNPGRVLDRRRMVDQPEPEPGQRPRHPTPRRVMRDRVELELVAVGYHAAVPKPLWIRVVERVHLVRGQKPRPHDPRERISSGCHARRPISVLPSAAITLIQGARRRRSSSRGRELRGTGACQVRVPKALATHTHSRACRN